MNNTRTLTATILMFIAATSVVAVGTFAATITQAKTESESSSTTCISDQPCQSTMSNSNTTDSPNVNHNRIHMSTTCISDQPCQSTMSNSTQSLSQDEFDDNKD
jgi:sensor c-di-GMP phosphodiesterase-like protein